MKKTKLAALTLCAAMAFSCITVTACSSQVQAAQTAAAETGADAKSGDHKPGEGGEHKDELKSLVESGKLSQTTYDAIQKYMQENPPEKKDGNQKADGQTPPAKPDGDQKTDGQTPPAKPEGDSAAGATGASGEGHGPKGMPGGMINEDTMKKLLDAGVITQDEYNTIKDAMPQPPEKPAETTAATTK